MASIQDILNSNDPEALKKLLNSVSSSASDDNSPVASSDSSAMPAPSPTPMTGPVVPPSQELSVPPIGPGGIMPPNQPVPETKGMGPLADPNKYLPSFNTGHAFDLPQPESPSVSLASTGNSDSEDHDSSDQSSKSAPSIQTEGFTNNTVEALKKAQEDQLKAQNDARLTNAMNLIGSSIAGLGSKGFVPENTLDKYYQDRAKDETITKNFNALTEKEKDDPNSQISKQSASFAQEMLTKAGFNPKLVAGMSYSQIEKNFPQITKMLDVKMQTDARRDIAREGALNRQAMLDMKKSDKLNEADTKRLDTINKLITPGLASSRSPLGKDVASLYAVQNAKALLEGGNLDDVDNRQIAEVARVLDRVLSGGNPTISGTEHLSPETARMWLAKKMEMITNKRQGAGASDFLKNNLHTFDREEKLAKDRIMNTSQEALASYRDIAERNPEAWDRMMADHNLLDVMGTEALKARTKAGPKNRSDYQASQQTPASSQEIIRAPNGKKYLVDHNTKQVIKEVQ